ncbi:MAG: biotin transporter BioY, partial [Terriglobales bacterium]
CMAHTRALADRVIPGEGLAWDALRIAAANLLMILCAQVAIPLPWTPVPVTGQTFGVMLVAVLLGSRRAAIALALYLFEGAAGLPVFQPFGAPGALRLLGPTAGYLLSYPLAAFLIGLLTEARSPGANGYSLRRLVVALVAGETLILTSGWVWLAFVARTDLVQAAVPGLLTFVPVEAAKIALVIAVAYGLNWVRPANSDSNA